MRKGNRNQKRIFGKSCKYSIRGKSDYRFPKNDGAPADL